MKSLPIEESRSDPGSGSWTGDSLTQELLATVRGASEDKQDLQPPQSPAVLL